MKRLSAQDVHSLLDGAARVSFVTTADQLMHNLQRSGSLCMPEVSHRIHALYTKCRGYGNAA